VLHLARRGGRRRVRQHVESTVNFFRLLQGGGVAVAGADVAQLVVSGK
jgi:hypothetical protein